MRAALLLESWKLRRSRVALVASLLLVLLVPLLALGLLRAATSDGIGALAAKGELFVTGTGWDAYLGVLGQVGAAALFVGAGIVVAWLFGREHADGTFGALFALAVSRADVARAKLVVAAAWALVVAAGVLVAAIVIGLVGGVGTEHLLPSPATFVRTAAVVVATLLLALPIGWVASIGRGYLPAVGAVIGLVATAQLTVFFGVGAWFPFSVPGLLAVADGETVPVPGAGSFAVVGLTILVAAWATIAWWDRAEVV